MYGFEGDGIRSTAVSTYLSLIVHFSQLLEGKAVPPLALTAVFDTRTLN